MSWRNLWRNKRRTIITVSSIFFALFLSIFLRSFKLGTYNRMIDNMVTHFSGHLQIQDKYYSDNPLIDNSLALSKNTISVIENNNFVKSYYPRIQTTALVSSGNNTKAGVVIGLDFQKENITNNLEKNIVKYYIDTISTNSISADISSTNHAILKTLTGNSYKNKPDFIQSLLQNEFDTNNCLIKVLKTYILPKINLKKQFNKVLVGKNLANYLELQAGDSIIIIAQGFRGATAISKYKIAGLLDFPTAALNSRLIYMSLSTTQNLLSAYEINDKDTIFYVNYIALNTIFRVNTTSSNLRKITSVKEKLLQELNNNDLIIVDWHKLNTDMIQGIEIDSITGKIFISIFYLIITLGILGTVNMMIEERKTEFRLLLALGTKRKKIFYIIGIELIFISLIAVISCLTISMPIISIASKYQYFLSNDMAKIMNMYNIEPVICLQGIGNYIFNQIIAVFSIILIVFIYIVFKINKLKIIF